jgi:NADH-quinone oxidoreductase subunit N
MSFEQVLLMRNELVLVIAMLIVLAAEIFLSGNNRKLVIPIAVGAFAIATIIAWFPQPEGVIFGGMYQTDTLRQIMKNVLNIGVLLIFIQSMPWLRKPEQNFQMSEFYLIIIATLIGMGFMISSGDFLMFYLGLETATIPVAALAAYDKGKRKSAEAGIKLILSSALSSGILLYGLSMIYGTTGSIYFHEVANAWGNTPLQMLAVVFFMSGMFFKLSIVPFHFWTADVYEGAPVLVTSYLSVISKAAAAFIFMIILFKVFPTSIELWKNVLYALTIITITLGNIFAIRQKNMKRFLAFSSIAQAGFILLGIIGGNAMGMTAVVYFALIYIFSNLAAFGVVAAISNVTGKEYMNDYDGLYRTNPKLSLVMMLALFSLAGIPPVAGFFGKFFLFMAAAKSGYYILVLIAVINTIVSLYYYLLVVKAMFVNKNEHPIAWFKSDWATRIALVASVLGIMAVGLISHIWEYINAFSFGI